MEHPYGGNVTIGVSSEPITLNPFLEGGAAEVLQLIGRTVWAGAVALDGVTLDPVPVLLSEIPTFENGGLVENEDGTVTVTYQIEPDATWEDGSRSHGRRFRAHLPPRHRFGTPDPGRGPAPYAEIVPDSLQFDDSTVTFDLFGPSLAYLDVFSIVVPAAQVGESDFVNDWNDRFWMSAGPFEFGEWLPGEWITMNRNDRVLGDRSRNRTATCRISTTWSLRWRRLPVVRWPDSKREPSTSFRCRPIRWSSRKSRPWTASMSRSAGGRRGSI